MNILWNDDYEEPLWGTEPQLYGRFALFCTTLPHGEFLTQPFPQWHTGWSQAFPRCANGYRGTDKDTKK